MSGKLTFENNAKKDILKAFDKEVDEEGYIVESKDKDRVLTREGEELKAKNLGLIAKGSEIFVSDNFASLVDFITRR
ncbi:MAG: hypothetical protein ABEJ99_04300 [Candidatus Nanohaloarchaea archaeon]